MTSLAHTLSDIIGAAFVSLDLPAELGAVRVSDRPDLAQFQCNGAMAAAKAAKKNPREIAGAIVEALQSNEIFAKLEIAGPGFINIHVTPEFLAQSLRTLSQDERGGAAVTGASQTIILDYGGPNIAKPMHVGHLRSSIIGDALRRMCAFAGYSALGDVHMGDWGTPMGMILSSLEIDNDTSPITMEKLEKIYPKAAGECKEDPARMDAAREATRKLQDGDATYRARWQEFIDVSVAGMKANFDALGVHFDLWKGEADVHDLIAPMVEGLRSKDIAVSDGGAVIVHVAREDDKKEIPPLILYKRDGAVMYGTTDLATIQDRMNDYSPARILYVVDQRQSLHFEQVFRVARMGGIAPEAVELTHAGFGTMNGPDGKPFKTRAGGVMRLEDLIAMGVEKATARLEEASLAGDMDADERADVAHKVAIAAIKFADLQNNRVSDYMFDLDRMTAFEGKTGPYLLYQSVRIQSLLKKAEATQKAQGGAVPSDAFVLQDGDRGLALLLCEWPDHFANALNGYAPHILCDYAFKLAQEFSSFYGNCHILSEEDDAVRGSRLKLCALTHARLIQVLGLLGIEVPARM